MSHHHFKHLRNVFVILVAFVVAGYPYVLVTGYLYRPDSQFIITSLAAVILLVLSFSGIAYLAHREHKTRLQDERDT